MKPSLPTGMNQRWSMDFLQDGLLDGRRFRVLTLADDYTGECLAVGWEIPYHSPE